MSQSFHRGRRLRWTPEIRSMVRETPPLLAEDLIMPYFVVETEDQSFRKEIGAMPGQYQLSLTELEKQVEKAVDDGLKSVILFGIPAVKDEKASGAYAEDGIVQEAVRRLKHRWPSLYVITDVCLCEYMSHGHCGILTPGGAVLNDPTLELLAKTAVSHAAAGADMVAPSDMMDGRVARVGKMSSTFGALYDSVLDRYSELVTLFGIFYYLMLQGYLWGSIITFIALIGSLMVSYVRARAEGLGLECKVGFMQRPERVVLTALGAMFCGIFGDCTLFDPMLILIVPMAVIAILANLTAFARLAHCYKLLKDKE